MDCACKATNYRRVLHASPVRLPMRSLVSRPAALVLSAAVLSACAGPAPDPAARASLVAAERAFARMAAERGTRDAFLAHFAPGGVVFAPSPIPVQQAFGQPPADPLATLLVWAPVASGVARSGDFGFTTGPATLARRDGSRPSVHSTFFSVWKRDRDAPWRVVLDAGATAPGPVEDARLLPGPAVRPAAAGAPASIDDLLAEERDGPWSAQRIAARLAEDALLQRAGTWPLAGAARIADAWPQRDETLAPLGGDVASSGDLAYTYGKVATADGAGHYVHLWTRGIDGTSWRLAALLRLP